MNDTIRAVDCNVQEFAELFTRPFCYDFMQVFVQTFKTIVHGCNEIFDFLCLFLRNVLRSLTNDSYICKGFLNEDGDRVLEPRSCFYFAGGN